MAQTTGRVAGKKAFITGAAQGLGAAAARKLASEGAKVALADINVDGAKAVAAEINAAHGAGTAFAYALDVTQEDQWIAVLEAAANDLGGISVLVNNAGVAGDKPLEQMEFDLWKKIMSINVDSVFLGAKHALTHMRAHQPGSIVNISSIAGLIANHNSPAYNASKAGVWLLSKNIALYCAKLGLDIRSNSIHPTFIDTPILDPLSQRIGKEEAHAKLGRQIPLGHIGEPDDIANAVLYLASDESKFMTGAELKLDGGISAM
ncbi:3-beta hydroxysteroid dehydrogenase [Caulobacter sp. D4A]|uniref:SDR family oxidoreductase n=1 Tax=unclassified Caulobacter TaxID=2648921 RepID=UPI000D72D8F8|nr:MULTISPECIES: SDR family oxidoreductase [unclassified Caulobacter]PXA85751.1 3-beta hydroxysteroid dehydrogenase [Caulobacter sp. D4A]PXA91566.1 3-beta hydroxysteroid dehydrogenase [Caulobacter sp. D5]